MTSTTRLLSFMLCGAIACAVSACVAKSDVTTCGVTGVLCAKGFHCAAAQGICIADATTICGDLKKDDGEACDDGNNIDGDGCSFDCKSDESCGNGKVDKPIPGNLKDPRNEDCEPPGKVDTASGFFCKANCKFAFCGNGITDPEIDEICDDGNTKGGDGCAADCKSTELCGNHIKDQPFKDANGTPDLSDPRNEICDDGNTTDGDGCSSDCRSTEACGNAKIDPGEECDDGKALDGSSNNADDRDCRSDCLLNRCGDGRANTHGTGHHEDCDSGPLQADHIAAAVPTESASCNIDCTAPACGDSKVNHSFKPNGTDGEQCDDGPGLNANDRDCTESCLVNTCGDTHTNTIGPLHAEGCDDGNRDDSDECNNACIARECGDGILNPNAPANEQCDLGGLNSDTGACLKNCRLAKCGDGHIETDAEECDNGTNNGTVGNNCSSTCKIRKCGNGIIDPGEQCDNGTANNNNADCRADCVLNRCGDGFVNAGKEQCEGAVPVAQGSPDAIPVETAGCNINCTSPACGDGILNRHFRPKKLADGTDASTTEQCDDGARDPDNNCSVDCQFERCGNGIIDPGEQCDGNDAVGPCSPTCFRMVCGNGIVDPGEECDNGGANANNADCRSDCVINRCGDGHPNEVGLHHEACDGGPLAAPHDRTAVPTNTNDCNSNCTTASCGDSIVNSLHKVAPPLTLTEQCDPPNAGHGCTTSCQLETCGNGVKDPNEQCDDGNRVNGDECENDCTLPRCGNGIPDDHRTDPTKNEQCDDGNAINTDDCLNNCKAATCGDTFVRLTSTNPLFIEQCDGQPLTCLYTPVSTPCQICATCALVPGTPLFCGDGIQQTPQEACDGGNRGCGTCSPNCGTVTSAHATGLIIVAPGVEYHVGDHFALSDGISSVTFEFVPPALPPDAGVPDAPPVDAPAPVDAPVDGSAPDAGAFNASVDVVSVARGNVQTSLLDSGNIPVSVENADNTAAVAIKLADAINSTGLHITVQLVGGALILTHEQATAKGNVPIDVHVTASTFATQGMRDGLGGACVAGNTCVSGIECQSNVCGSDHKCVAPAL